MQAHDHAAPRRIKTVYVVVLTPRQVVLVVRVEVPDRASPWAKENQDLVDRILTSFPGTVDYSTAIAYYQAYLVGLYHCADVLVHAPTQEVGTRRPVALLLLSWACLVVSVMSPSSLLLYALLLFVHDG